MTIKQFDKIKIEVRNSVAYLEISNPKANTLSTKTLADLSDVMDNLKYSSDVKAIVVTGEGKFFAAGADIQEFTDAFGDEIKGREMAVNANILFNKIEKFDKPVIAAVNGPCLGGGLELAMACHMQIASDDALFGMPELKLGLIPGYGGTQRLPGLIGKAKATELILTSKFIKGQEAEKIGLVNQSVPAEELLSTVTSIAESVANYKSPLAVSAALTAINNGVDSNFEEGLRFETEEWSKLFSTKDMEEGVTAFIEKRDPIFTGE
ncbi:enoyl-CoA hydratase-related protein [Radiobacillus sp. PE A8.2]|uniref:enoyl-CoA hydratase-related protein n=1 Tax=Radiobacillus sp. PE A8.2 TaxID=3380349 RepID=UPI00388F7331